MRLFVSSNLFAKKFWLRSRLHPGHGKLDPGGFVSGHVSKKLRLKVESTEGEAG